MNLRNQLSYYLKEKGLSASALAKLSGVPKTTLHAWISGKEPKSLSAVRNVALALGTSVDHLVFGNGPDTSGSRMIELENLLEGTDWLGGTFEIKVRRVPNGGKK